VLREVEILKALAEESRLRIVRLLGASEKSLCVCELVNALGMPQYEVSKHLATLRNAELLEVERRGTWAYYSARRDDEEVGPWLEFVQEVCVGEVYEEDRKRLSARLTLRAGERCVVGFVGEEQFVKLVRSRKKGIPA